MADSAVSEGKNGVIKSIFCCPIVGENVEEGGDLWGGRTAPSTAGVASRLKGFPVYGVIGLGRVATWLSCLIFLYQRRSALKTNVLVYILFG